MAEPLRTCCRTGCNRPAAASLSFRYETRQVWVTAPPTGGAGHRYDLCAGHADNLIVPQGWHRVEERAARHARRAAQAAQPAAGEPRTRPARGRRRAETTATKPDEPAQGPATAEPGPGQADRYARLLSELPGVGEQVPPLPARGIEHVERSLSPPTETSAARGRHGSAEEPAGRGLPPELVGQLAIPVPERTGSGAVIVSLTELAGARRERETLGTN